MNRKTIKPGEWFLLPFAGAPRSLLVRAVRESPVNGHWEVADADGRARSSYVLLSSCHPCSPGRAARIRGTRNNPTNGS